MVKLGVIGRNFVVDWLLGAAEKVPEICPVAVCSRDPEAAKEFAEKYRMPYIFGSVEEMGRCPEVDAVYIASPNYCHYTQSKILLEHGKHVLCEKPATVNAAEVRELIEIAKANGVVYLEAMRLVHDDALDIIRDALPEIGALRRVSFEFSQYSSRYDRVRAGEKNINAFNRALSNGSIMDMGCYPIHAIVKLFGRPERVCAMGMKLDTGFDGNGSVMMQYPGFYAEAVWSKVTHQVAPTFFLGEDGAIFLDNVNRTKRIWLETRKGEIKELPYEEKLPINMTYQLRHFCDMIRGEMDPAPWNEASIITMEVMDEARKQMDIVFPLENCCK